MPRKYILSWGMGASPWILILALILEGPHREKNRMNERVCVYGNRKLGLGSVHRRHELLGIRAVCRDL